MKRGTQHSHPSVGTCTQETAWSESTPRSRTLSSALTHLQVHRVEREPLVTLQPVVVRDGGGRPLDRVRKLGRRQVDALGNINDARWVGEHVDLDHPGDGGSGLGGRSGFEGGRSGFGGKFGSGERGRGFTRRTRQLLSRRRGSQLGPVRLGGLPSWQPHASGRRAARGAAHLSSLYLMSKLMWVNM